jgi:hypothetical protein
MKQTAIAAVIERDLLRADNTAAKTDVVACWSCGYTFRYRSRRGDLNGNFCSARCQEWYDAGNPSFEEQRELQRELDSAPLHSFTAVAGPPDTVGANPWQSIIDASGDGTPILRRGTNGFYIRCAGCQKEFESKGLRCCSAECERRYRERQENLRVMAEAGIEPAAKRACENCGTALPKWSKGRLSKNRFCSARCQKAQRRTEMTAEAQTPFCPRRRERNPHEMGLKAKGRREGLPRDEAYRAALIRQDSNGTVRRSHSAADADACATDAGNAGSTRRWRVQSTISRSATWWRTLRCDLTQTGGLPPRRGGE